MYKQITVGQVNLSNARDAPEAIDGILQECLLQSRPVYVELPTNMVSAQVSSERLGKVLNTATMPETDGD